jgi:signal transduction histidine kinase
VAGGDFTPQVPHTSTNEIGELSRTFEAMVAEIARVNHELIESERLATIGKMAAHVTHEVRNPLSSIALNLELLEEELPIESEAHTLFVAIRKEVERLTELTEQYLTVARRRDPNFAIEDIGEVVAEAVEFMSPELRRHEVVVAADFAAELPAVKLDEGQIRQVIHNLLRNAREAMPSGGDLRISVGSSTEIGWVDIDVADTGAGMSDETRARLFEPFFTTRNHGTGLGLAISRHIVEAHGGLIRCEPNEPRGTRFVVRLPAASAPAVAAADAKT